MTSAYHLAGRLVARVEWAARAPLVTVRRAASVRPAQREAIAAWLLAECRDRDPECRLTHDDCYALLWGR